MSTETDGKKNQTGEPQAPVQAGAGEGCLPNPEELGWPQPAPTVANKLGLVKF